MWRKKKQNKIRRVYICTFLWTSFFLKEYIKCEKLVDDERRQTERDCNISGDLKCDEC